MTPGTTAIGVVAVGTLTTMTGEAGHPTTTIVAELVEDREVAAVGIPHHPRPLTNLRLEVVVAAVNAIITDTPLQDHGGHQDQVDHPPAAPPRHHIHL